MRHLEFDPGSQRDGADHERELHGGRTARRPVVDRLGRGAPRGELPGGDASRTPYNLRSALREILEINRADALAAMEGDHEEVSIEV